MSIGRRLSRIIRAKRSAASQEPENPISSLDGAHQHQLDLLDQARRSVADVAANRRRVELLAEQAAAEVASLNRSAEQAVQAGNDDGARQALQRSITVGKRLESLTAQRQQLDAQVRGLEQTLMRLEHGIEDSRLRYQSLKADHNAAQAALGMRETLTASGQQAAAANAAAREAEQEARRMQAQAAAYEELSWSDQNSPQVLQAFEELETRMGAEEELRQLKERRNPGP
ncbi:PspA/IM30 family protein [Crystallibacter degradans]|uniref:PspA/IM30 family protein n=1 Tax=Crystallibacter degradans TaxID=2726743 RepID=UPI001474C648|nr:PspA/IM30 family protein [Arthrobacter sp. SF27]NMR31307.1 PspA/IM30 family protein [Arthrobacter sp. SF27]